MKSFFYMMVFLGTHDMWSSVINPQNHDLAKRRFLLRLQRQRKLAIDLTALGQAFVVNNHDILGEVGQSSIKDIRAKLAQNRTRYKLCVQQLQGLHRKHYEDEVPRVESNSKSVKFPSIGKGNVHLPWR